MTLIDNVFGDGMKQQERIRTGMPMTDRTEERESELSLFKTGIKIGTYTFKRPILTRRKHYQKYSGREKEALIRDSTGSVCSIIENS